jgi:hypothetical protein
LLLKQDRTAAVAAAIVGVGLAAAVAMWFIQPPAGVPATAPAAVPAVAKPKPDVAVVAAPDDDMVPVFDDGHGHVLMKYRNAPDPVFPEHMEGLHAAGSGDYGKPAVRPAKRDR